MSMLKYAIGLFKNITNFRISKYALIDTKSTFHRYARVYRKVKIVNSSIGAYTYIAPRTDILYADIGKFCSIGPDCLIGLPEHSLKNLSTSPIFTSRKNATNLRWAKEDTFNEFTRVQLGNDIWIGSRTIIKGGVKIGHGAIIGAGAIVTKDIPNYAIAVGVPAHVIKYRFEEEIIKKLLEIEWWDFSEDLLKKSIKFFNEDNINIQSLTEFFKKK